MIIRLIPLAAACALLAAGCSSKAPSASAPVISDKAFDLSPNTLKVKAGVVSGELSGLKVVERVEQGTGRVDSPPRLNGKLVLHNLATDQAVQLRGGKIVYLDARGQPIALGPERTPPEIRLADSYGQGPARLEPGEELSRDVDVDFPQAGLSGTALKDIRVELSYSVVPFKREALDFPVSVSVKQARAD
jgi:hypothetical protein